jgi:RNA polymerase sigma-70 factor (ECF subfamily)
MDIPDAVDIELDPGFMGEPERTAQFVQLLAACERRLAGYVLALVPNLVDADEILQETKLRLWDQFDEYDAEKDFGAWARSVAYYQVLTFRKKRGRAKVVFSSDLVSMLADEMTSRGDEVSDRASALLFCIKRLNKKYQNLLGAFYGGPSTVERAAEAVGMTVAAAQKALARSRRALHECFERRIRGQEAQSI